LILQLVAGIHCGFLLLRCASPAGVAFLFENKVELVNAFHCEVVACSRQPAAGSRQPVAGSWELGAGSWELVRCAARRNKKSRLKGGFFFFDPISSGYQMERIKPPKYFEGIRV
jgi:hypothetical protein